MKNLILKIPTSVFIFAVIFNLILYFFAIQYPEAFIGKMWIFTIGGYVQLITIFLWSLSLIHYFKNESNSLKLAQLIQFILLVNFSLILLSEFVFPFTLGIISLIIHTINTVLIYKLIRKTFYARSKWFLFVELLFVIVGIITLTPDVKKWEKSDKK